MYNIIYIYTYLFYNIHIRLVNGVILNQPKGNMEFIWETSELLTLCQWVAETTHQFNHIAATSVWFSWHGRYWKHKIHWITFHSWAKRRIGTRKRKFREYLVELVSYNHLLVITGYFYGIIHSTNGIISTYNWYFRP